ncbi:MAG TPA: hypothetical protein VEA58_09390 [Anaerovoracaceae bacterium]|nr:hypothetical protein [Anaerovoracaceae bacterium]
MSNAHSYAKAFAPIEQANRQSVAENTWGHLAPKKNCSYRCKVLFAVSAYESGTRSIIDTKFEKDLESSPWLYDSMLDMIYGFELPEDEAGVYLLEGTFRNYKWSGKPKKVYSIDSAK